MTQRDWPQGSDEMCLNGWKGVMKDIDKELAIRLAWYIDRYGEIPKSDMVKLWGNATLGRKDEQAERIFALADEILEYFGSVD